MKTVKRILKRERKRLTDERDYGKWKKKKRLARRKMSAEVVTIKVIEWCKRRFRDKSREKEKNREGRPK